MFKVAQEFEVLVDGVEYRVEDVELTARDGELTSIDVTVDNVETYDETANRWVAAAPTGDQVERIQDAIIETLDREALDQIEADIRETEEGWDADNRIKAAKEGY